MIAARWIVLVGLALGACAAPYSEVQADWPPTAHDTGRIVFLGGNYAWYGLFEGMSWEPVLSIDYHDLDVGHGTGVYFVTEVPVGRRRISIDGEELLQVHVDSKEVKYVEMHPYPEANRDFSLRKVNYKMRLTRISEAQARARLDNLEYLGVAE